MQFGRRARRGGQGRDAADKGAANKGVARPKRTGAAERDGRSKKGRAKRERMGAVKRMDTADKGAVRQTRARKTREQHSGGQRTTTGVAEGAAEITEAHQTKDNVGM